MRPRLHRAHISIHAPRVGSDATPAARLTAIADFNPRSPRGERRWHVLHGLWQPPISIHAPRVGSDIVASRCRRKVPISIHAPRVGSDGRYLRPLCFADISIHAPRVGSDTPLCLVRVHGSAFQSTLPAWGATRAHPATARRCRISIHAPRVGSDVEVKDVLKSLMISIHAPRVGSDADKEERMAKFGISIHAPRVGSDRLP